MSLPIVYRNAVTAHGCALVIENDLAIVLDDLADLTANVLSDSGTLAQATEHAEEGHSRASEIVSRLSWIITDGEQTARGQERDDDGDALAARIEESVQHAEALMTSAEQTLSLIRQALNDANTAEDTAAVQALDDSHIVTHAVRPNEFALMLGELVNVMARNK